VQGLTARHIVSVDWYNRFSAVPDVDSHSNLCSQFRKLLNLVSYQSYEPLVNCENGVCRVNYALMSHMTWDENGNLDID